MKHLFIVKKGSFAIWKRLDPTGYNPERTKNNSERIEIEKCLIFLLIYYFNRKDFFIK